MPYYLSYVVVSNPESVHTQHASLAITEHDEEPSKVNKKSKPPRVIARFGFFATNQVMLEDSMNLGPQDKAHHKTYPISKDEVSKILAKVNKDRQIEGEIHKIQKEIDSFLEKIKAKPEDIELLLDIQNGDKITKEGRQRIRQYRVLRYAEKQGITLTQKEVENFLSNYYKKRNKGTEIVNQDKDLISIPGGPKYSLYRFNCKSYALSVMKEIGLVDNSLSNWGVDMPTWSGELKPLKLENGKIWRTPLAVSKRLDKEAFSNADLGEIAKINVNIRVNDYRYFLEEIRPFLQDPALNAIPGIDTLRKNLSKEMITKVQKQGKTDADKLLLCENHLNKAIEEFSTGVKYGFGTWLADCLKRALNYLGGSFVLSPEYKTTVVKEKFLAGASAVIQQKDMGKYRQAKSGEAPPSSDEGQTVQADTYKKPVIYRKMDTTTPVAAATQKPDVTQKPEPIETKKEIASLPAELLEKIKSIQKLIEEAVPLVDKWLEELQNLNESTVEDLKYKRNQLEFAQGYKVGLVGLLKSLSDPEEVHAIPSKQEIMNKLIPELRERLSQLEQLLRFEKQSKFKDKP